jgi:hypothetical protein
MNHYDHSTSAHDAIAHPHVADTVLMVRPVDFAFNEQTATDNEFQNVPERRPEDINRAALEEFEKCVTLLRDEGVNVIVLEKPTEDSAAHGKKLPDAVFPNNWIGTHPDGNMVLYPMATPNRRDEALRHREVQKLFHDNGFSVKNVIQVGREQEDEKFLEGTGSMVIDHVNRTVYAARSVRTEDEQLENYMRTTRYYTSSVVFDTKSSGGLPFYHTNVMMSIGDRFAVVCTDCIVDNEINSKQQVIDSLKRGGRDVIEISLEQAEKFFCGNILQVKSATTGQSVIAMSESCLTGFTSEQLDVLGRHGKIVAFPIAETIEFVGGGSARCMLAEVFLPKKSK